MALKYAAVDPSIKAVVLLSPGLHYKGVIKEMKCGYVTPFPLKNALA